MFDIIITVFFIFSIVLSIFILNNCSDEKVKVNINYSTINFTLQNYNYTAIFAGEKLEITNDYTDQKKHKINQRKVIKIINDSIARNNYAKNTNFYNEYYAKITKFDKSDYYIIEDGLSSSQGNDDILNKKQIYNNSYICSIDAEGELMSATGKYVQH